MSQPKRPELTEPYRRRLIQFCRWYVAIADSPGAHRESVEYLARRIDLGSMSKAETLASLDAIDELLSEVWDRRPEEEE